MANTYWFFGLSGAGKTTLTDEILKENPMVHLDGDILRNGINKDLGFSKSDRSENLRRTAEITKIFNNEGIDVICSFITPLEEHRDLIKRINKNIKLIFCDCPLEICEERDVKGLYKLARAGRIKKFTGVSSAFESGTDADLKLQTYKNINNCVKKFLVYYEKFK